jgi:putative transposase
MCRLLAVSVSGYYAWRRRPISPREQSDTDLARLTGTIFTAHQGRYGVRRIHAELARAGRSVAYKRVQRLMVEADLRSVHPRPYRRTTIPGDPKAHLVDLVDRDVSPAWPNLTWVGDITYIPTWTGWAYLATVIDCHSRKIIGWAVADHMRTDLVITALDMAVKTRRPAPGVIFHSDRGSQYTSDRFRSFCTSNGGRSSVGKTGICSDNAVSESFFATLKKELVHLRPWPTLDRLRAALFDYIETYYNRRRLHSTLGYRTPHEYESAFDIESPRAAYSGVYEKGNAPVVAGGAAAVVVRSRARGFGEHRERPPAASPRCPSFGPSRSKPSHSRNRKKSLGSWSSASRMSYPIACGRPARTKTVPPAATGTRFVASSSPARSPDVVHRFSCARSTSRLKPRCTAASGAASMMIHASVFP